MATPSVLKVKMDPREVRALSKFFFSEQVKFTVLQLLVLLELAITSDSPLIYALCGGGGLMLLTLTLLLSNPNDDLRLSLLFFYPAQVAIATFLLSIITLLKVYIAKEQTDLSLIFLSVAMLSENAFLVKEAVPKIAHFIMSQADNPTFVSEASKKTPMYDDWDDDDLSRTERCIAALRLQKIGDFFSLIVVFVTLVTAVLVFAAHFIISGLCTVIVWNLFINKFLRSAVQKERRLRERSSSFVKVDASDIAQQQARDQLRGYFFIYVTVICISVEFVAVSIAMAVVSGGATIGGRPR